MQYFWSENSTNFEGLLYFLQLLHLVAGLMELHSLVENYPFLSKMVISWVVLLLWHH